MSVQSQGGLAERLGLAPLSLPPLSAVMAEWRRDRFLFLAVAAYLLVAIGLAFALGKAGHLLAVTHALVMLRLAVVLTFVAIVVVEVPRAIAAAPAAPLSQLAAQVARRATPRLVSGVTLFAAVAVFYGAFATVKTLLPSIAPFTMDTWAANVDRALHGGHDPWTLLQPIMGHHLVTRAVQMVYLPGWLGSMGALTLVLACARRFDHLRARFFWTFFGSWILLGNIAAAAVMTGGPVYFGRLTGDTERFAPLLAYHEFSRGMVHSSADIQDLLWSAHLSNFAGLGTGISAFPSMHVAMAVLFFLVARHLHRGLGVAYGVMAVVVMATSVHLGWHYAIDGYASALVVAGLWWLTGRARGRAQPT
jgi:hypothetical protein